MRASQLFEAIKYQVDVVMKNRVYFLYFQSKKLYELNNKKYHICTESMGLRQYLNKQFVPLEKRVCSIKPPKISHCFSGLLITF